MYSQINKFEMENKLNQLFLGNNILYYSKLNSKLKKIRLQRNTTNKNN